MKKFVWLLVGLSILGGIIFWIDKSGGNILNPLSEKKQKQDLKKSNKVFGFLPTWMVGKTRLYGDELSHLIFLGIEVESTGDLVWDVQSKKINNDDFLKQKRNISKTEGKNILGIKLFEDEKLDKFLSNKTARGNLIKQVTEVVKQNNFDGVNIDFEYQGNPVAILNQNFGDFLDELRSAKIGEISVDVFVNTIVKGDSESLKNLVNKTDYLILMAYDFHRPGVDFAGAVAPIRSKTGERNITEGVEKIIEIGLDKNKIIMAYPLYGYEWKTYTQDFGAAIKRGWYQMSSWKRTKDLIKEKNLEVKWDELSMTPWLVFEEGGQIHQIYFENKESMARKIELVKNNQLGGYGFWALGYEGEENVF